MPSIEQDLRTFIAQNILFADRYPYPDQTSFLESGIVDSMNVMEIVLHTEEAFGLTIDDQEIVPANFDSIQSIAAYVRRKTGQSVSELTPGPTDPGVTRGMDTRPEPSSAPATGLD